MKSVCYVLLLSASFLLASCTGESSDPNAIRIGMMPKLVGIPYFNACHEGAKKAAEELGVELVYDGPSTADSNQQVEIVNSWVLRGFSVVAVAPNNPEAIAAVLKEARAKGVHVLTWDTDSVAEARDYFCNQVDNVALSRALVDVVVEEAGDNARVALISGTETASNQNTWMRIMRQYQKEKYPRLRFIDPVEYPGEDGARSYQSAAGLLRRPQPPDAIVGMTSVSAPAAAKAVKDAGMSGKVVVTGITLPSVMRAYVADGTVKKFVLWSPFDLGYLTVHVAKRIADGALGGAFSIERLGEFKPEKGEIILGPPLVFDAENIDRYDF
jgi:ABC-type sugar transport system substrate-binding protein